MAATLYLAAFDSAQTPTWARADIANGRNGFSSTGYITSGTNATGIPTSGTGNDVSVGLTLSGLSAGTSYKIWLIWDDGTNTSNSGSPIGSAAFVTPTTWTLSPGGTLTFSGTAALSLTTVNTYTITPSGSVVFSGTNLQVKEHVQEVSGTVVFSGSAALIKEDVYEPSGSITFSGTAPLSLTNGATEWTITPSGGITFSGAPLQIHENVFEPSGSLAFSGTNAFIKEDVYEPSGSVTFGGTAPLVFIPAGSVLINTYRPLTGVGH